MKKFDIDISPDGDIGGVKVSTPIQAPIRCPLCGDLLHNLECFKCNAVFYDLVTPEEDGKQIFLRLPDGGRSIATVPVRIYGYRINHTCIGIPELELQAQIVGGPHIQRRNGGI